MILVEYDDYMYLECRAWVRCVMLMMYTIHTTCGYFRGFSDVFDPETALCDRSVTREDNQYRVAAGDDVLR